MFSFLKGASFWLWLGIIALYTSGVSLMAYNKGVDKGLDRIGAWQQETAKALVEAMNTEHERQMKYIEEREPIIIERIETRDKWRTKIEQVILDNPSPSSCALHPSLLESLNALISEANSKLPD